MAVIAEGRRMIASYGMSDLMAQLDAGSIIQIHRSHIINLSYVASIRRVDANRDEVVLKSGKRITASRTGSVGLRKRLAPGHRPLDSQSLCPLQPAGNRLVMSKRVSSPTTCRGFVDLTLPGYQ